MGGKSELPTMHKPPHSKNKPSHRGGQNLKYHRHQPHPESRVMRLTLNVGILVDGQLVHFFLRRLDISDEEVWFKNHLRNHENIRHQ